jgi:hypothetical protein
MVDRVFTIPDDLENTITIKHKNETFVEYAGKANNFQLYFKQYFEYLNNKEFEKSYSAMLEDAKAKNMIINSI